MIVKFSTSIGQLTMHGDAAVALLKGMGHSGTVPGAILAADLPDALAQLQRMLETAGDSTGAPPLLCPWSLCLLAASSFLFISSSRRRDSLLYIVLLGSDAEY
jgi:hypothetical protein